MTKLKQIHNNIVFYREYYNEAISEVVAEADKDAVDEINSEIERLNKENELLKMDISYLGAKRKLINMKFNECTKEAHHKKQKPNVTLDVTGEDYMLTMVEDRMSMSFNDLNDNNLSNIRHEKEVNYRSMGDDEFIRHIDEIKEEDLEESDQHSDQQDSS